MLITRYTSTMLRKNQILKYIQRNFSLNISTVYHLQHLYQQNTKAYLTSITKTTNPNILLISKRFGFECFGADGGSRTHTLSDWFLRPACLPFHHIRKKKTGETRLEHATDGFGDRCSTIELLPLELCKYTQRNLLCQCLFKEKYYIATNNLNVI